MRRLVEAMEIPIFNRVSQIKYSVSKVDEIDLTRDEVSQFHQLEQVTVVKRGGGLVDRDGHRFVR